MDDITVEYTHDVVELTPNLDTIPSFGDMTRRMCQFVPKKPKHFTIKALSRIFAERLVDPITKSEVVVILDAMKGAGKSVSALRICEDVAKELSLLKYGDFDHVLEFFNPEENVAIITPESIHKVLKNLEIENQVILLDDAGNSIGNRDSATKSNKLIGKLLQTMRIKSAFVIITTPSAKYVDVQLRELATHYMHVEVMCHDDGFNLLSCKRVWVNPNGEYWKIHLTAADAGACELGASNTAITRWRVGLPTKKTLEMYEAKRLELTNEQIRQTQILLQQEREKNGVEGDVSAKEKMDYARRVAKKWYAKEDSKRALIKRYGVSKHYFDIALTQLEKEGYDPAADKY